MGNFILFKNWVLLIYSSFDRLRMTRKTVQRTSSVLFSFFLLCLLLNITHVDNLFAQGKNPKIQTLDTLPPSPKYSFCPHGANAHKKEYVHDKPDIGSIRSNLESITLDENVSYNFRLSYGKFEPCYDSYTDWKMEIIDNRKDAYGVVTFTDCAGNDTTLYLPYFAVKLDVLPNSQDFGYRSVGDTVEKKFYIKNMSKTSSVGIKYLQLMRKDEQGKPQGFTIWDSSGKIPLPTVFGGPGNPGIMIQSLDSFSFIVRFNATQEGEFWDSIGLGDTNNFWYKAYAHAEVGYPIIDVSDGEFPETKINKWSYSSIYVQNKGTVPLLIYGYKGPEITGILGYNKIYHSTELAELNFSENNPLRLQPNEILTFNVGFAPDEAKDFSDSIVFISNTIKNESYNNGIPIDSVCVLKGKGVVSGLLVNSYDWGSKRIHMPETFPVEPYPAVPDGLQDSAIRLTNNGYYVEGVTKLTNLEENGDINSFKLNRVDLITTVSGGTSKVIPVSFQPTNAGEHQLKIKFNTYDKSATDIISTLNGTGTIGRLETEDCDLGSTKLNDFENPNFRNIVISNLDLVSWQYGDSVTIYDLVGENICDDISSWEDEKPFRYDKEAINFPVVLQTGESITLNVEFVATKSGKSEAKVTTKSDAEFEITANLVGYDTETGVESELENGIEYYPNPASDMIKITGLPEGIKQIKIIDILGNEKINYQLLITNYETEVDVRDFASGVYLIQVILKNEIISQNWWIVR